MIKELPVFLYDAPIKLIKFGYWMKQVYYGKTAKKRLLIMDRIVEKLFTKKTGNRLSDGKFVAYIMIWSFKQITESVDEATRRSTLRVLLVTI